METISENLCFDGIQHVLKHNSVCCNCDMTFAVYMPPQAKQKKVPALWFLSGLTCTHENAMTKANAQCFAAKHGIAVIFPDTSPRGDDVADDEAYDLGKGAGFYVNATQTPWKPHYQMWDYISKELPKLILSNFQINTEKQGITGHSMGGHGALTIAMNNPDQYKSLSAFAPITNPTASDWGSKQLSAYLGCDESNWTKHDASILIKEKGFHSPLLIDQGTGDNFLELLKPEALEVAMETSQQVGEIRMQEGYDHSYFFIQSFIEDHIKFHAEQLNG